MRANQKRDLLDALAHTADEVNRLREINKELARLCEKALQRSAIVHPGFAEEIRAALAKARP